MNEVEKQITEYINNKIYNYGFLLKGQWGCGKSYFIKEFIKNDKSSKIFFYISLNGLTSIEDIDIKLIEEITKNIRNNTIQGVTLKNITKQLNIKNIFGIINREYSNVVLNCILDFVTDIISRENVVLVFDDLERCKINYIELLAYINSYIETQEMKVILVANEDEIQDEEYDKIKEKAIGHSIEFIPNIKDNYEIFINNIKDIVLKEILLNNTNNLVTELYNQEYSNMRTLQFIIDKFVNLYNIVIKNSEFYKDVDINEIIFNYIIFSSIMYKKGKKIYDWKEMEYGYISIEEGKYSYDNFRYGFKFIDIYIYKGIIDKEEILNVLRKYKDTTLSKDNPYTILKNNYWELEDEKIYELIYDIKDLLLKRVYKSGNVLDILLLLLKLQNRDYSINIEEFMMMFKEIIKKDFENDVLVFNNSFVDFIDTNEAVKNIFFERVEKLKKYIAKLRFEKLNIYINNADFSQLFLSLESNIYFNFIIDNGFFCNINIDNLINSLKNSTALEMMQFKYFCDKLLDSPIYIKILDKEIVYINEIVTKLEEIIVENSISRRNAIRIIADNLKKNTKAIFENN